MTASPIIILNVDDVESVRYAKTRTLQLAGFTVEEAATGYEALEMVQKLRPVLVLLDVRLPDISGIEVCKIIRRDYPMTLILQISASYVTSDDRVLGLDSGADSYLAQPIEPAELIAAVRALLRIRSAEEKLRRLNDELEERVNERTRQLVESNERLSHEIVEREKAEASLIQSQKSEAMGQLTGGIAHDFNNLLMIILSNLNLLQKRLPLDDEKVRRYFDGAKQGAERGVTLTQRLLAFARKQDLAAQSVDLPGLVMGLQELIERSIGPMIEVTVDAQPDLPAALIDPNQLELAVLNLAVNARDAMQEKGDLRITLRLDSWPGSEHLAAGEYLVLRVQDSGRGMDADTLARATEPFFSTKGVGKGTGLGLAMVHGFLLQSGGALVLSSELGKGTIADLWIPVAEGNVQQEDRMIGGTTIQKSRKILVVDDEPLLVMTTADMLADLGHEPLEAGSGQQALDLLGQHPDIALMITDHAMAGMTGAELAKRALRLRPELKIILATGYDNLPEDLEIELERLPKPYFEQDLIGAIDRLMAGKA